MDVIFEPQRGRPFSIEVGFFDTVLEIKEKIHKYQGIPVQRQTLVFNGHVLQDDRDVEYCEILQNSHIQLFVAPDQSDKPQPQPHSQPQPQPPQSLPQPQLVKNEQASPSKKIHLRINIPSSKTLVHLPLDMDINDTILHLKEKIHDVEPIPVNRLVVQSSGAELQDHRSLCDCELMDNSEVDVNVRPSPTASGGTGTTGSKKLKLMVLPKCGTKKIPVEVNATDNVGELRKELQKLHQRFHFHLPQDGYFFIYKQNVMDDDRSFRWHHVGQGDTIEIFNGSVTGGS
ncbi:ubiquitin domain-containing protein 7SL RNA1-like [Pistacia vera]|uniref:ubiquitin domain-containing protein 7SL RNA1-like n=1 Tax=Pistacia vera TaxID=55513 RepID=UPI001262B6EE|nr:ubiquitin domain-containing protein 7SL RNA1-like [Pistacia vera]